MKRRALLSVTDKAGVVDFARGLAELGFSLLSTGGTHRLLREAGVDVEQVADYTGFPEILGGRVKTLHPKVHGGILAPRAQANAGHAPTGAAAEVMAAHGIDPIDVVAVNLYRFRAAAERAGASAAEVREAIDIGGPCMIRAAAKNHEAVAVVTDPADYPAVLAALRRGSASELRELRHRLAAAAFRHTAAYDAAIAAWFGAAAAPPGDAELPGQLAVFADKVADLRYGENQHQRAAFYSLAGALGPTLASARQLGGKELSFNNLVDLDAALAVVLEFDEPACAIIKHTNPCGAAVAPSAAAAFAAAHAADPMSAFGGVVAVNSVLDAAAAQAIVDRDVFVEAIVAPDILAEAASVLQEGRGGGGLRLLSLGGVPGPLPPLQLRQVRGGLLVQTPDAPRGGPVPMQTVTARAPTAAEAAALSFAWKVCKHVKSNAIVLAAPSADPNAGAFATVGVGAGQMSRVDSVEIAASKAGEAARGAVLASDAFFPFPDGVELAARAGVTAVIQPGGSRRDPAVIEAANRAGMAMVFTGMRHFRH